MSLEDLDSPSPHPLSDYIKLISSEGNEFIVNKSVCLASGTIRAMLLAGPGDITIQYSP
jgi:hypothetical protein